MNKAPVPQTSEEPTHAQVAFNTMYAPTHLDGWGDLIGTWRGQLTWQVSAYAEFIHTRAH